MIVLISLIVILCVMMVFISKRKDIGIPMLSGAWPVIGHTYMLLGDNVHLYRAIVDKSMETVKKGGCATVSLGIMKYYFFTNPDDCAAIFNASMEKHYLYSFSKAWLGDGLICAPAEKWHVNKKLLYPMFQQQNLNKFLTVFNKQGRRLVKHFSEHVGKGAFNHENYALLIGLETICQTALGSNVGEQMARNKEFVGAVDSIMDTMVARFKKIWLHFQPIYEISSTKKKLDKHLEIVNNMAKELIMKRKSRFDPVSKMVLDDTGDFSPFVDTIINISLENENFDDKQILDEINTLILTGYDTTSLTITFTLMYLGHYQDVQEKVYKELTEVFGDSDRDVEKYDLSKLTYLEAVIKETLRVHPLAPVLARKIHTDVKIKNYTIPAGSDCFISIYGIHRSPEWGDDAEVFNQDRWLNPETMPKNPNLFAPFGLGKRYCVGKTYGMMTMKTTLSHVLRNYRIKADLSKLVTKMLVLIKPDSVDQISLEPRDRSIKLNHKSVIYFLLFIYLFLFI